MADNNNKAVVFDLDAEKRPESEVKPPFVVTVNGREITMKDPSDVDWRDLAGLERPTDLVRIAMSSEDRDYMADQEIEAWRFNRLMEAYYVHYDMEKVVKSARRREQMSSI